MSDAIVVRNPHSVLAALKARPKDVVELCSGGDAADAWKAVQDEARRQKVQIKSPGTFDRGGKRGSGGAFNNNNEEIGRAGSNWARIRPKESVSLEELFAPAALNNENYGLWLALDCLQDPHNVGAIFRAAAFFGVRGIVLTEERSAPLTGIAYEVASGGIEHVPFVSQINLRQALDEAKEAGLWMLGTSEHAKESYRQIPRDRNWMLVLGNEERGMRKLTTESCDMLCAIPPQGEVGSLNVSVAAGILMAHFTGP